MHKELLVFSWLNGQMRFVSVARGQPLATWDCEETADLEDPVHLGRIISEAVARTNYRGKHLGMVIEHAQLTQQLLETPPTTGRDLESFVARQVDNLKIFEEKPAFSFYKTHPTRGSHSVMLYLLPDPLRNRLIYAAQQAGLHLLVLVAPSALFCPLVAELPMSEQEAALLGVSINGSTSLVAGRKDGELFLTRSIQCDWAQDPDRIASQINRSVVFVRQQFGVDITRIHLIGPGAQEAAGDMQGKLDLPITTEAPGMTSSAWPLLAANFPPRMSANLISREQQRAPQKKVEVLVTSCVLGLLTAIALALSLSVEVKIFQANRRVGSMQSQLADLRMRKTDLEKAFTGLEHDTELAKFIGSQQLPPIPAMFLSYIANKLPEQLILTKLQVKRNDQFSKEKTPSPQPRWSVKLEGSVSWQATGEGDSAEAHDAYVSLTNELANGPFQLAITERTKHFIPRREKPSWSTSVADKSDHFLIEGVIGGKPLQPTK